VPSGERIIFTLIRNLPNNISNRFIQSVFLGSFIDFTLPLFHFLRINLSDEGGKTTVLFFDKQKLHKDQKPSFDDHPMTMFFKSANLEKEDIIVIDGQKSGDIVFANEIKKIDTQIFSKVSEAKKWLRNSKFGIKNKKP